MHGGRSMFKYVPVRSDGQTREWEGLGGDDNVIGVHAGDSAGLNVANPRPGYVYQWPKSDPTSLMHERARGGEIVREGDEDCPAYVLGLGDSQSDSPTPLDTSRIYGDVVLMRYDEKRVAERRRQVDEASLQQVSNAEHKYLNGANSAELATSDNGPTRYAERRHQLEMQDERGITRDRWRPNPQRGIMRD